MDEKLQEIEYNLSEVREDVADLDAKHKRDRLLLYGDKEVHIKGLIERVEFLEDVAKNINGLPQEVQELRKEVRTLIETDRRRVNFIKGAIVGYGIQAGGLAAVLIKVFS